MTIGHIPSLRQAKNPRRQTERAKNGERGSGDARYRAVSLSAGMSHTKLKPNPSQPPISRAAHGVSPRPCGAVQSDRPNRPTVLGPVDTVVENGTMNAGSWRERIRSG